MKDAIASFIKNHPVMSFLLADIIVKQGCSMVKTVLRGYPEPETHITNHYGDTAAIESENDSVVDEPAAEE